MDNNFYKFNVQIYSDLEPYNEVISKARVRIFYKYGNRNGTYITDGIAEQMLNSLPYTPLKGIYSNNDFGSHDIDPSEGKIYGIIPENANIKWEEHKDSDGVSRTYACADVLLFTAIFKESKEIINKSLSMELYKKSLSYHFQLINGIKYAVFDHAVFLGLQILGDSIEPCFEGAGIYIENIEAAAYQLFKQNIVEGAHMNFNLKISVPDQNVCSIFYSKYNKEQCDYLVLDSNDKYMTIFDFNDNKFYHFNYTLNEDNTDMEIISKEETFLSEFSREEINVIKDIIAINGGSDSVADYIQQSKENFELVQNLSNENNDLKERNSTLQSEKDTISENYSQLKQENDQLKENYSKIESNYNALITEKKEQILNSYKGNLSEEIIENYRNNLNNYSVIELDKELAYECKNNNPSFFQKGNAYVAKENKLSSKEQIYSKYKK